MRALIYDDDEDFAQECAEALARRGYETETRAGRTDFAALVAAFIPDLILLDVHMPDFNGIEALQTLARDPRKTDIAIVMMSGAQDNLLDACAALCEALGIRLLGTLPKPIDLALLDHWLTRPATEQA